MVCGAMHEHFLHNTDSREQKSRDRHQDMEYTKWGNRCKRNSMNRNGKRSTGRIYGEMMQSSTTVRYVDSEFLV